MMDVQSMMGLRKAIKLFIEPLQFATKFASSKLSEQWLGDGGGAGKVFRLIYAPSSEVDG